jgi:hypothetical protein
MRNYLTGNFANSYKSGNFVTQFSLRMRRDWNICGAARNIKLKNVNE